MKSAATTLVGCSLVTFILGSIHAYSVLLTPLEIKFAATRDAASLGYSIGLAFLTLAVLFGHRIYERFSPGAFVALVCTFAAAGAYIASLASSLSVFILGYGVVFGTANGLGYGYCLQLGARNNPANNGLAITLIADRAASPRARPFCMAASMYSTTTMALSIKIPSDMTMPITAI